MLKSKIKICRSLGEKIFPKCSRVSVLTPPGMHGRKRKKKVSEFGVQLKEKQKLKFSYGLRESQLKRYFQNNPLNLVETLEKRLDNVLYRLGLAESRASARQLVSHGHIFVNKKRVNISSYEVKTNDQIILNNLSPAAKEILKKYQPPEWLSLNRELGEGKVVGLPNKENIDRGFNTQLVTEYYSR